ncbi:MAG: hypothetical protein JWM07_568 [Candidatus Saccharibacteria bacterium]|nr:hypothetical protein [Candidatus Saccharibacteria bacterium]
MTHPESAENPFNDLDKEFAALLNGESQRIFHGYMVRSLANEKARILDALVDHIIAFDSVDIGDYENFTKLIDKMTDAIEKDFAAIEGLKHDDEIVASGKTIALVVDMDDPEYNVLIQPLVAGECLRGEVDGLFIQEIPSVESLKDAIEDRTAPNSVEENNLFGISLRLKNAHIENDEGDVEQVPENYIVMIPLNYPTLILDAIVKTETTN